MRHVFAYQGQVLPSLAGFTILVAGFNIIGGFYPFAAGFAITGRFYDVSGMFYHHWQVLRC